MPVFVYPWLFRTFVVIVIAVPFFTCRPTLSFAAISSHRYSICCLYSVNEHEGKILRCKEEEGKSYAVRNRPLPVCYAMRNKQPSATFHSALAASTSNLRWRLSIRVFSASLYSVPATISASDRFRFTSRVSTPGICRIMRRGSRSSVACAIRSRVC